MSKIKYGIFVFILFFLFSCLAGCTSTAETPSADPDMNKRVALICAPDTNATDSYMAYKALSEAQGKYGVVIEIWQPRNKEGAYKTIIDSAEKKSNLIIITGSIDNNRLAKIAENYPETGFAIIGDNTNMGENVMSLVLKDHEASFLAGVAAALTTQTGKVAFIADINDDKKIEYAFRAGVRAMRPEVDVIAEYIKPTDNIAITNFKVKTVLDGGVDLLFQTVEENNMEIIEMAKERNVWVINEKYPSARQKDSNCLCVFYKKVDDAVYYAVQNMMENKFSGGVYSFGIDFMAVGIEGYKDKLEKDAVKILQAFEMAIALGDVAVPDDRSSYEHFRAPDEGWNFLPKQKVDPETGEVIDKNAIKDAAALGN